MPVKRATPKNPRLVLGNATFEDMARMLSAGKFDEREPPAEASKKSNDVENMVRFQVLDTVLAMPAIFHGFSLEDCARKVLAS